MSTVANINIVRLERRHVPGVLRLLRETYGKSFYGADETYFDWLYEKCPCDWFAESRRRGKIPVNGILDRSGEVTALHAFQPFDAATPWGGTIGIWDIDWINGTGIRGAGRRLARHLVDSVDVYAGYGYGGHSEVAFKKMGLHLVPAIPRMVFVLEPTVLGKLVAEAGYERKAEAIPTKAAVGTGHWHRLPSAGDVPEDLLAGHRERTEFGVLRTRSWLAWRYDDHPYIHYDVIAADPLGVNGAAMVRLERIKATKHHVARILDVFEKPGHEAALFDAVLGYAAENGAILADYFSTSVDRIGAMLRILGDQALAADDNPAIPFMFQPIAYGAANSINLVIAASGLAGQAAEPDFRTFRATKADSNQDISREGFGGGDLVSSS